MKIFDLIIRFFFGKKILVIGDNNSGKTTLQYFLRGYSFCPNYESTSDLVFLKPNSYKNGKIKFHLRKGVDLNGDRIYNKYWENLIKESNYVIFLFNTYNVYHNDKDTIRYLNENLPLASKLCKKYKRKLIVIGNYTDKIYNFDENKKDIKNKLRPFLANALDEADIKFKSIIFGNMKTRGDAAELLSKVYPTISKYRKTKFLKKILVIFIVITIITFVYVKLHNILYNY